MVGDVVSVHRRVADVAQVAPDSAGGAMPANSGRDGSDEVTRIRILSMNGLRPCTLTESLARAYPCVEYVAVLVVT
jgi:hypothetical protein